MGSPRCYPALVVMYVVHNLLLYLPEALEALDDISWRPKMIVSAMQEMRKLQKVLSDPCDHVPNFKGQLTALNLESQESGIPN